MQSGWSEPSSRFTLWKHPHTPLLDRNSEYLNVDEQTLRRIALRHNASILLSSVLRQAWHEYALWLSKGICFRCGKNTEAVNKYRPMTPHQFDAINARQNWANWRTIPRNLSQRLPNRPVRALDLCSGTGQSTAVLATYLAPHSTVLGLEFNPEFVMAARQRAYYEDSGRRALVSFRSQSVLDPFCHSDGRKLSDGHVDLVHSSGAVGCHFQPHETERLAREIARVVSAGGLALIDSGRAGTDTETVTEIFEANGFNAIHCARSCALDRYTQVCFRRT